MALTIDDLATILAAQAIMNNTTLSSPVTMPQIATTVPYTSSSTNTFTVFTQAIAAPYGARLATISVSVDAVFEANYKWLVKIASVTSPGSEYQSFDPTVNVFDSVPSGKFFLLKPGSNITISAFNNNSSNGTNGIMSVYTVYDQLTAYEAAAIGRYNQLLKYVAGLPPIGAPVPPTQQTTIQAQAYQDIPEVSDTFIE